jgi:antitoxin PrlF
VIGENEVRILKARPLSRLYGVLSRPGQAPVSLEAMDEAIAVGAAERVRSEG